ncbi:VTC domain-containing protein [Psychroserpens sp.]|uniref:VTC domain-containing protein n=1 Tax=Psychroserpens sp. TaxID=2020870 RepID=UPI00385EA2DD
MAKKVDNKAWRFERKYQLSLEEYLQFEKLMMLSDMQTLHPDRQINNCYFDNVTNNAYTESVEGYSEKMKVRIRWYGDLFHTVTPKLEFKLKQNHSNKKETFKLFKTTITKTFDWENYIKEVQKYIFDTFNITILNRLEPVLINTYRRSYYSNFEKTFRLTIDRDLKFISPSNRLSSLSPQTVDAYIIELKFNNKDMIKSFPLVKNLGKFSKFTAGVELVR